jgi:hypothetical protein
MATLNPCTMTFGVPSSEAAQTDDEARRKMIELGVKPEIESTTPATST